MAKVIIGTVAALVLVGIVAYFVAAPRVDAPQQSQERQEVEEASSQEQEEAPVEGQGVVLVAVNDEGFTPRTIEARAGDRIVWVNEGSRPHWPASDVHPTHEVYAELDPLGPIAPGQSWEFVAAEVGRWTIHDHLAPDHTGTVVITEG